MATPHLLLLFLALTLGCRAAEFDLPEIPGAKSRNIVLILTDDHRYDAMGFMGHPFLETPHLDSLARGGVHCRNAFVTTALCSPSRASILSGLYAHKHGVVDNNNPIAAGTRLFPHYLQAAGYDTGFFGKWHMGGDGDDPQPGWSQWVSFRGQGVYWAKNRGGTRNVQGAFDTGLNVNGQRIPQNGYITDELTDHATAWLRGRSADKPFMLYLSHKAVHAEFIPADRHKGRYADKIFTPPASQAPGNDGQPMWVKNQRNSWHGMDYPYHSGLNIEQYYKAYCETLLAVDESVGRVIALLREKGMLDSALVVYMGDNGFMFGEHGLIDKRTAYEESMRVPMILHCPEMLKPGTVVEKMVAGLDMAPTFLDAAGLQVPEGLHGRSVLPLARGEDVPWRSRLLYEYYWERNFPQTPTVHAIRTDKYKYIHAFGIWDTDELYDIVADPGEMANLVRDPEMKQTLATLNTLLFDELEATGGMYIPLQRDRGKPNTLRNPNGSTQGLFPDHLSNKPVVP